MRVNEIITIGNKSMIQVINDDGTTKAYSIVSNLDNSKAYGNKWSGTVSEYLCWNMSETEAKRRCLEEFTDMFADWSSNRYEEIIKSLINIIKSEITDDDDELVEYLNDNSALDEDEMEHFGVEKAKRYDIVTVRVKRTFYREVELVVPKDTDEYELDNYFNTSDIDDLEFQDSDNETSDEIEIISTDYSNITYKEARENGSWNDIDDLDY